MFCLKTNSLIYSFIVVALLTGCSSRIPLNSSYFNNDSKVGLLIVTHGIERSGGTSGGLTGLLIYAATNNRDKYTDALIKIGPELNPKDRIKKIFIDSLEAKGKRVIPIGEMKIDTNKLKPFVAPNEDKKYYKIDVRFFNEDYQLDELLIVDVHYGIYIHYTYGVETRRYGKASIYPTIVNLKDNSILYKDYSRAMNIIYDDWNTPPDYQNLKNEISKSINETIAGVSTIKIKDSKKK